MDSNHCLQYGVPAEQSLQALTKLQRIIGKRYVEIYGKLQLRTGLLVNQDPPCAFARIFGLQRYSYRCNAPDVIVPCPGHLSNELPHSTFESAPTLPRRSAHDLLADI